MPLNWLAIVCLSSHLYELPCSLICKEKIMKMPSFFVAKSTLVLYSLVCLSFLCSVTCWSKQKKWKQQNSECYCRISKGHMTSFNKAVVWTFHSQNVNSKVASKFKQWCDTFHTPLCWLRAHNVQFVRSSNVVLASCRPSPTGDGGDVWIVDRSTCGSGSVKYFKSAHGV